MHLAATRASSHPLTNRETLFARSGSAFRAIEWRYTRQPEEDDVMARQKLSAEIEAGI